jgi:hypothetical protein
MSDRQGKPPGKTVATKRRKVPVKLSLDPALVSDVRGRLQDGLSLSSHVARLLRQELERGPGRARPGRTNDPRNGDSEINEN